jgi:formyl-CoA transferase
MVAPYQVFPTRDGELMIAGGNDRLFAAICQVVGLPELAADTRFATNPDRVARREELFEILVEELRREDTATWWRRLVEAGVPAAPVADVRDVIESPQTEALGMMQAFEHPRIDGLRLAALPLSLDGERVQYPAPPPDVGRHTVDVLRAAGYDDDDIATLEADGVIRT